MHCKAQSKYCALRFKTLKPRETFHFLINQFNKLKKIAILI